MKRWFARISVIAITGIALVIASYLFFRPRVPEGPIDFQIEWVLERAHERGEFSGRVLVAREGEILVERSYGLADVEEGIPNTPDTKFPIGSLAKPITAVLVLQQMEAGRMSPEQSLAEVFPALSGTPVGAITVHQLLTHTSGIEEVISRDPQNRITPEDLRTANLNPDSGFEYSNSGFVCLALILEAVTSLPYETLVEQQVFEPAGMRSSGVARTGRDVDGLAKGYGREGEALVQIGLDFAIEVTDGAGSLYSTVRDLYRFEEALAGGVLISQQSLELMGEQHVRGRFGYGWFLNEQGGMYYPWHTGELPGYASGYARQIHRGEAVLILSNIHGQQVRQSQSLILRLLKQQSESSTLH
jgi:CubicO group peptidase (beta-lactamase class C family)